jgi:hypothetical protein
MGSVVILRSAGSGRRRLVSARILMRVPDSAAGWSKLKTEMITSSARSLSPARHRYLVVPPSSVAEAKRVFKGTKVTVLGAA